MIDMDDATRAAEECWRILKPLSPETRAHVLAFLSAHEDEPKPSKRQVAARKAAETRWGNGAGNA